MFFGATPFAATTFAGIGSQSVQFVVNGNRLNVSIGNVQAGIKFPAVVTGNRFNVATGSVSVVSWQNLNPGAGQTWIPIDPLNP
tara:strand:+ start:451 stop:702 length:252 start_codon:yes stop_codon:yes gene_type:complete